MAPLVEERAEIERHDQDVSPNSREGKGRMCPVGSNAKMLDAYVGMESEGMTLG